MAQKFVTDGGLKRAIQAVDQMKVGPRHQHVTSDINDLPVGAIIPAAWGTLGDIVHDAAANTWLQCNGQTFDPADYPDLVGLVQNNTIPNLTPLQSSQPFYMKATDFRVFPLYPIGWLKVLSSIEPRIFAHHGEWLRCDGRAVSLEEYPDLLNLGGVTDPHQALIDIVGPMISNTEPGPAIVSSSSDFSDSYLAHRAFGRSQRPTTEDAWLSGRNTFDTSNGLSISSQGEYLKVELPEPTSITRYGFRSRNTAVTAGESSVRDFRFEASNDDHNWVTIEQRSNVPAAILPYQLLGFNLFPTDPYKYWRFRITGINIGSQNRGHIGVSEFYIWRLDNIPAMVNLPDIPLNRGRFTYINAKRVRHVEP